MRFAVYAAKPGSAFYNYNTLCDNAQCLIVNLHKKGANDIILTSFAPFILFLCMIRGRIISESGNPTKPVRYDTQYLVNLIITPYS